MFHLVYTSHSTQQFSEADLILLLTQCRDSNKLNGITGMLLYLQGKFIQVLEGKKTTVETLYSTIKKDPRHTRIITVIRGTSPHRLFSGWTMGFKKLSFEEAHHLSGFRDIDVFFKHPITEDSNLLLVFLGLFYKKNIVDYAEL
jgi:hypothetical protein